MERIGRHLYADSDNRSCSARRHNGATGKSRESEHNSFARSENRSRVVVVKRGEIIPKIESWSKILLMPLPSSSRPHVPPAELRSRTKAPALLSQCFMP